MEEQNKRDADMGSAELACATFDVETHLECLARAHPDATVIAFIDAGDAYSPLVLVPSAEFDHYSPMSLERVRALARIIGRIDPILRRGFELELAGIPKIGEP